MKELDLQNRKADEYYDVREVDRFSKYYSDYWFDRMLCKLEQVPTKVLDVCCGTGVFYKYITEHAIDVDYTGIELSGNIIERAKELYPGINIIEGDICEVALPDKYDLIVIRGGLHHLKDPKAALDICYSILDKNGALLISEPIDNPVFHLLRKIVYSGKNFSEDHVPFSRKSLKEICGRYDILSVDYLGVFAFPFAFPDIIKLYSPYWFKRFLVKADRVITKLFPVGWHMIICAGK